MSPERIAARAPVRGRRRAGAMTRLAALAAPAMVTLLCVLPVSAGGVRTDDCAFARGGLSCTHIWRDGLANPYVMQIPQPQSEEGVAEAATHDRLWRTRCHPVVQQDAHGVKRYSYAAPGCEYGKYE